MSDRIEVSITALGSHGVLHRERQTRQPFDVTVSLEMDLRNAGFSDDLADTIDYADLAQQIRLIVEESSFALIEKLADAIAEACLKLGAISARVRVGKPAVANLLGATSVAVEVERP